MNWYLQSSHDSDVAKSTRIRFARNLVGLPFNGQEKEEIEALENKMKENSYTIGYGLRFISLKDMDDITKMSLVEKNLISPEFVLKQNDRGSILINEEENICIMIGGKEQLEIQIFNSGFDLKNTLDLAVEVDEKIGEVVGYSVHKKYGFLTADPNNLGTGLRASVMLHLPALAKTKNTRKSIRSYSSIWYLYSRDLWREHRKF